MSKKFENIVNAPHRAFKRAKDKLLAKKVPENTPDKIVKIGDTEIKIPVKKIKQGVRISKITLAGLGQFIAWALKYGLLDNHLTRKLEELFAKMKKTDKKGKEKLWRTFVKNNPNLVGHITYYLATCIMTLATIAGVDLSKDDSVIKETVKEWITDLKSWGSDLFDSDEEDVSVEPGTYGAYKARMRQVTPLIIADIIAKEGVKMENGMHVPYKCSKGVWTIGYGSTVLKDGSPVTPNTPPITTEEAYELARYHLEDGETYFMLYCYDVAFDKVDISTVSEAVAMNSLGYNAYCKLIEKEDKSCKARFEKLRELHKQYADAVTDEQVKELFDRYPVRSMASVGELWLVGASKSDVANRIGDYLNDGAGIRWRRWLEACILNGDITPQQMLDVPINGMYEFFKIVGRDRKNWFTGAGEKTRKVNKETLKKFQEWIKNPVDEKGRSIASWQRVRDVMPSDVIAQCMAQSDKLDTNVKKYKKTKKQKIIELETYVIGYEELYADAIGTYQSGDYNSAAKKFEKMIEKYPGNALLHNDLAATYNHLGRYNDAIEQVREIVWRIGAKEQYGAAQYNAGFAYEQLGDLEKARDNYRLAVANGNSRAKKDLERVTQNLKSKTKSKKVTFDDAAARVKQSDKPLEYYAALQQVQENKKS